MSAVATTEQIRRQFPALGRRHQGHHVAYFDGPGGTQVPARVVDAVSDYLLHHNANTHWAYPTSHETDAALLGARAALADWLGGRPEEIVFGANMTTLTFHLGRALGQQWHQGDAVVVTELDHHANSDTWRRLARERELELRVIRMRPEDGRLDMEDAARKLTRGVRLLAVGAASNALGTVNDVAQLTALAHAAGALVFVDGVHYAAHHMPDVHTWDCDFFACSAYKFYGPHVGVLWGRQALLDSLDAPRLAPATPTAPDRLETGTLNHEGIVGAGAAIDFSPPWLPTGSRGARGCGAHHRSCRSAPTSSSASCGTGSARSAACSSTGRRRVRRARRRCRLPSRGAPRSRSRSRWLSAGCLSRTVTSMPPPSRASTGARRKVSCAPAVRPIPARTR